MRSLYEFSGLQQKKFLTHIVMSVAVLAFIIAMIHSSVVHAAGAIGSGGGASGGSGGAQTSNGWGWYNYPTSGGKKPYSFRDGTSWSYVSNLCSGIGADRVIAFTVLRVYGTDANNGVVYNYKSSWDGFSQYRGNSGPDWLKTSQAKTLYDSIDVDKTNFTWGSNVAWFCYSSNPFKYTLSPSIDLRSSSVVEVNSGMDMIPIIDNTGPTNSNSTTAWKLTSFQVAPGNNVPHLDESNTSAYNSTESNPCDYYSGAGVSNCGPASFTKSDNAPYTGNSGTGLDVPATGYTFSNRYAVIGDLPGGTRICYALSVAPRAYNSSQWRYSNPRCVTVGISPKVQVWGSDLTVGNTLAVLTGDLAKSNIQTSTSIKDISGALRTFGSWVEYGAQASGEIIGFGSGSAYAKPGLKDSTACKASLLSFTNGGDTTCADNSTLGGYVNSQPIPDVAAGFPITSSTNSLGRNPSINLSSGSLEGVNTATGNITITGGTVNPGRWFVLNAPNSTVTITGNINYGSASMDSIYDIPQVVIIAKNINIRGSVTNVDAWLIASGTTLNADGEINTCSDVSKTASLSTSICNKQLIVNGPVVATKLYLRRTYGSGQSGTDNSDPAELFNTRADAYLWAYIRSLGDSRAQTVYSIELPPRL